MNVSTDQPRGGELLLYHFGRLQWPNIVLSWPVVQKHLHRTLALAQTKWDGPLQRDALLERLYPADWFLCVGCLEGVTAAWEALFASRTGRSDCLLADALRGRAARLYPRDEEAQESAVTEFWSLLLVAEIPTARPVLERYDGLRPLVPWLIRVFQNLHLSRLRKHAPHALPGDGDDVALPMPGTGNTRWHEAFCLAARAWLSDLSESERLILGLRMRYRMSQREVAQLLGVHEGTISRQTTQLRDRCLDRISRELLQQGWTGDNLEEFVLTEMASLLLDDPQLSADQLASLLAARGKAVPTGEGERSAGANGDEPPRAHADVHGSP